MNDIRKEEYERSNRMKPLGVLSFPRLLGYEEGLKLIRTLPKTMGLNGHVYHDAKKYEDVGIKENVFPSTYHIYGGLADPSIGIDLSSVVGFRFEWVFAGSDEFSKLILGDTSDHQLKDRHKESLKVGYRNKLIGKILDAGEEYLIQEIPRSEWIHPIIKHAEF